LLTTFRTKNHTLETEQTRLTREVDVLRKWRRKLLSLMSDLVRQDEMANDQLTTIAKSCSDTCWRRGIEYSRLLITMQTLLSLFEELQISPDGG
jgi:hemerythrin-like domain-containing protein